VHSSTRSTEPHSSQSISCVNPRSRSMSRVLFQSYDMLVHAPFNIGVFWCRDVGASEIKIDRECAASVDRGVDVLNDRLVEHLIVLVDCELKLCPVDARSDRDVEYFSPMSGCQSEIRRVSRITVCNDEQSIVLNSDEWCSRVSEVEVTSEYDRNCKDRDNGCELDGDHLSRPPMIGRVIRYSSSFETVACKRPGVRNRSIPESWQNTSIS